MSAGKEQHISLNRAHAIDYAIRPLGNLLGRFSSRRAVPEKIPVRACLQNVSAAKAFVFPIIPLHQVGIDRSHRPESCQFASPDSTLQWAGKYLGEGQSFESCREAASV